jgi:DNA-directed RNA polymerase subunit L/DNA-directed RNA polymerase alpha subunit
MMTDPFSQLDQSDPFSISFKAKDLDLSVVNSLRRIIISEIKNVGFFFDPNDYSEETKDIRVLQNDTPLHNEFLQHRISLIPIHVSPYQLENWNKEDYKFVIDKSNTTNSTMNVYSSDIQVIDAKENKHVPALSKQFFPADPITKDHIIITKLNPKPNATLHVEAHASLNSPSVSTSFGMISNVSIEFTVDEKKATEELNKYLVANKDKASVESLTHQFNSIERERHYFRNKYREPNNFDIQITSECSIPCVYIFRSAIDILKNKIIAFQNSDYDIVNNNMLFSIIVKNESHTLGNLFQSLVFNHYIRENLDNEHDVTYIGYNVPHPLEQILLIKVKGDKLLLLEDVRSFVNNACDYIYNMLNDLENHWNTLSNK